MKNLNSKLDPIALTKIFVAILILSFSSCRKKEEKVSQDLDRPTKEEIAAIKAEVAAERAEYEQRVKERQERRKERRE